MGTYIATFTLSSFNGAIIHNGSLLELPWNPVHTNSSGSCFFNLQGNCISIDGGALISLLSLPAGFTPRNDDAKFKNTILNNDIIGKINNINSGLANGTKCIASFGVYSLQTNSVFGVSTDINGPQLKNPPRVPTSFDLFSTLQTDLTEINNGVSADEIYVYDSLKIYGSYDIISFPFTYTIPITAINTTGPNNLVSVTSTYPTAGSLNLAGIVTNGITQSVNGVGGGTYNSLSNTRISGIGLIWINLAGILKYYYIPIAYLDPISFNPLSFSPLGDPVFLSTLLRFYIPLPLQLLIWQDPTIPGWPNIPMSVIVYGDGTQFSGWVRLGSLTITLVNASGVYKITPNKANDTLYDNLNPPATNIVKIPNPFIKTGFIE